jgi:hypothetical protein
MTLGEIHGRLGTTGLYFMILMALWGLFRYFRKEGVNSNYWGALAIGEILIVVQGLLGAYLWIIGERPERSLHVLCGIAAARVFPGVYAYTKGNEERRSILVYGVALLVSVLLIMRAISTAGA